MNKIFKKTSLKYLLVILLGLIFIGAYQLGLLDYLNLDFLKNNLSRAQAIYADHPLKSIAIYFSIYLLATTLSFPGAALLSMFGGAVFGTLYGVIIVSFASSIGATFSFWVIRFLLKDYVGKKFQTQFAVINKNIEREGAFYLLSIRLIPIFPFFVVNMAMGLTSISSLTYFIVSQIGMLPGTIIYVYAGKKFSELTTISGILNPQIILVLVLLGALPFMAKFLMNGLKNYRLYKKFKKPKNFDFTMLVIGGGAAGLVTAFVSAAVKAKVALVEKNKMGGDCLNYGCVPSKALIKSSKVIHLAKKAQVFGLKNIQIDFDFAEVMARVKRVIDTVEPHDSASRYSALGVECISGEAHIISPYEVKIGEKIYTTQNITIATGSKPLVPKIPGIEKANYVTSETVWDLKILPKKFLIIGGGPIGCELAQCFARLGSEVTIIEKSERLLIREDLEVSALLAEVLTSEGVRILTHHSVQEFVEVDGVKYLLCATNTGVVRYEYDLVLIAMGRRPNTKGFGLEDLGVVISSNGTIETNEYLQTTYPNIFACGDVAGPYQLTHTAAHQAWYCAVNGLFGKFRKFEVDYSVVPWCTYTDPEVATVGVNEEAAKELKLDYEVTIYHLDDLDRAIADDETKGFVKVITQKGSDKILGATIMGTQASTMILEFISAMKFKKGLNKILGTIHIYPSLGEANKYAAGVWKKAHAPTRVLFFLEKYFKWIRK
jgi:dihydrolipoamide dehydrogenase